MKKIVLAYSGGLDTSVILKWLQIKYSCPIVTFTADIGQGEELQEVEKKAKSLNKEIKVGKFPFTESEETHLKTQPTIMQQIRLHVRTPCNTPAIPLAVTPAPDTEPHTWN